MTESALNYSLEGELRGQPFIFMLIDGLNAEHIQLSIFIFDAVTFDAVYH